MTTWYASYLLVVSWYLCSNVFIWCCCCFRCLKNWKNWVFLYFFDVLWHFPRFSDIFHQYHWEVIFQTLVNTFPETIYATLVSLTPLLLDFSKYLENKEMEDWIIPEREKWNFNSLKRLGQGIHNYGTLAYLESWQWT